MNAHESLDRILAWAPRKKVIAVGIALLSIAIVLFVAFRFGVNYGEGWTADKYIRERDARLKEIERYKANEIQLAAENSLLRKQNEATAEILKANDKKIAGDAAKFAELLSERAKRMQDIDLDKNFDSQLCGICTDSAKAGFPLSEEFCKRCTER